MTAREAYARACKRLIDAGFSGEAACLDARALLSFCWAKEGLSLLLNLDGRLTLAEAARYELAVKRLAEGEPMAYITGRQDFGALTIRVVPGVLIPRHDSLILVEQSLARLQGNESARVLELGCGSGALIVALAVARPRMQALAVDVDPLAIELTRVNLARYSLSKRVSPILGSWFENVDKGERFDLILSNPPYIASEEMLALEDTVKKEPVRALWGGTDGLDAYRRILPSAYTALKDQGWCLVEIGWKQGPAVVALFRDAGFDQVEIYKDEGNRDRVVAGRRIISGTDEDTAVETGPMRKRTRVWKIGHTQDPRIREAGRVIREGGLVAFPTETVYGLGANGLDENAVAGIYRAKGRPADNPLILHVASLEAAKALTAGWTVKADRITAALWPGPLTIVAPAAGHIPGIVTAGLDTVAIRYPSNPIALALIEAAGVPIAAPSANTSGRPSPTRAEHVLEDMDGRIDILIDSGPCAVGIESTIVDLSVEPPLILRPGEITREALSRIIGEVRGEEGRDEEIPQPKAPGMKYRHYAPKAPVVVLRGEPDAVAAFIAGLAHPAEQDPAGQDPAGRIGLLLSTETWRILSAGGNTAAQVLSAGCNTAAQEEGEYYCRDMGGHSRPKEMGHTLYDALRACDSERVRLIYAEACAADEQGAAILNRLRKASGNRIIEL